MMLLVFCHLGHGVHEIDGVGKIIELERPLDVLFLQLPLGDLFHSLFQLGGFDQVGHIGTTSNTRKLFCNDESSLFFWLLSRGHPESQRRRGTSHMVIDYTNSEVSL